MLPMLTARHHAFQDSLGLIPDVQAIDDRNAPTVPWSNHLEGPMAGLEALEVEPGLEALVMAQVVAMVG